MSEGLGLYLLRSILTNRTNIEFGLFFSPISVYSVSCKHVHVQSHTYTHTHFNPDMYIT